MDAAPQTPAAREACLPPPQSPAARAAYLPVLAAVCLFVLVVLRTAWVCDDAYITFRTIENFLGGDGLRWNIAERVQVYTHPLWLFLLAAFSALTRELYLTTIVASVVLSVAAVLIVAGRIAVAALPALVAVMALTLSKAFTDYSTSGLENPLTHLLLALFALVYFTGAPGRRTIFWLSLLAALLALTRLDALLLVAPALAVKMWRARAFRELALGFIPLIAWELFSLVYYGFLLPNTAYAKLITGLPHQAVAGRGFFYVAQTLQHDPLTLIMLAVGLLTPLLLRAWNQLPLVLGALLYLVYIIWIGGDFMLGRFLTAPLLIAVVLLVRQHMTTLTGLILLGLVLVIGLSPGRCPLRTDDTYGTRFEPTGPHGLQDERGFYYQGTGLLLAARKQHFPDHPYAAEGLAARRCQKPVVRHDSIGMFGFFAGRDVFIVDELGLADAFLARLAPTPGKEWSIGHLRRKLPAGYLETVAAGRNRITDPALAAYYDRISLITRGRLFDSRRWAAIAALHFGLVRPP
jgi:arabinofuranosyltransferase